MTRRTVRLTTSEHVESTVNARYGATPTEIMNAVALESLPLCGIHSVDGERVW